jgi:predicted extracellular nuclease
VTVPADQLRASFDVTAGASEGAETVTASIGGSSDDVTIQVAAGAPNCLIFSEYIEGSGSNNKAFELYNCSPGTLDLSDYGTCLVSNDNTTCSQTASLPGNMLGQGDVFTICKTSSGSAGDPVDGIANNCDLELGNIANFNGNDRLVVFVDENNDDSFDSGDTVTDAFGEIAVDPGSIWSNTTYRRCDFTQFDGMSAFDVDTLYTSHPEDDASDFGTAPTEGCP